MRPTLGVAALFVSFALVAAQDKPVVPDEVPPRYGQQYKAKEYPQATPKQALESVLAAADKGDVKYLVAQLLDPAFVDARVADRTRQLEPEVVARLAGTREAQRRAGTVPPEVRIPTDPAQFQTRATAEAQAEAFAFVVRGVQAKLLDDPEGVKDLRQFCRGGSFPDAGAPDVAAKVGLPDVKDRAVFLKKVGDRWFVENRQVDERVPEPKNVEPKKE